MRKSRFNKKPNSKREELFERIGWVRINEQNDDGLLTPEKQHQRILLNRSLSPSFFKDSPCKNGHEDNSCDEDSTSNQSFEMD